MHVRNQKFEDYLRAGRRSGTLGPFTRLAFNMHGLVAPEEWLDIMPQIFHVHAKFYDIDENGDEPAMDIPRIVRQFVVGGYQGYSPASGRATRSRTWASPTRSTW